MGINIWAEALDIPGNVCSDARLSGGQVGGIEYPKGTAYGQAGWAMGLKFSSLADLAVKLYSKPINTPSHIPPIKKGTITRLGIHAHGLPGIVFLSGQDNKKHALTTKNIMEYHKDLHAIGLSTTQTATILIVGCLAGYGWEGRVLLESLSKLWPGRTVVAFTTIGFASGGDQLRSGEGCTEPGMRDTDSTSALLNWEQQQQKYGPLWKDLKRLPWASETSPHAKVAVNGKIIRKPKGEIDSPPKQINYEAYWMDKEVYKAYLKLANARKGGDKRNMAMAEKDFMDLIEAKRRKGLHYKFPGEVYQGVKIEKP